MILISQQSGIYQILNKINGRFYIGSATNLLLRWCQHKYELNLNKHGNTHLQRAWNKYGIEAFEFKVLELCEREVTLSREQWWIDWTEACKLGYNQRLVANSNLGIKWTAEQKAKISNSKRGVPQDPKIVFQRNVNNMKLELWPHGSRCKCDNCRLIRNKLQREYRNAAPGLKIVEPKVKK